MPSDSLLPLLDALLRLRRLDPAELEALLRQLPSDSSDAQAVTRELLQRDLPPDPPASVVPAFPPPEHPGPRETILVGFGDDDAPLDPEAAAEEWSLPTDDEPTTPQPEAEPEPSPTDSITLPQPATVEPSAPVTVPAESPDFVWDALKPATVQSKPAVRENETDRQMRQVMAWSGKGLLVWVLFLGSFFIGVWLLRPAPPSHPAPKPTARSAKASEAGGERWWESQPLDVDAVVAAQQAKARPGQPAAGKAPSSIPKTTSNSSVPNLDKSSPPPGPKLPAGAVVLGRDDQPQMTALAFRDNYVVATGNEDGRLMFWDVEKGTLLNSWAGHKDRVNRLAFSAGGRCLVSVGNDRMVRVWNGSTGTEIRSWASDALSVSISTDGRYVAVGCVDGVVRLTDLSNGESWSYPKESGKPNPRHPSPLCLAFNPDSSMLAVGYGTGQILMLDLVKRKQTQRFTGHGMVYAAAFSPDGTALASGGKDGTIKLWDLASGRELRPMPDPKNQAVTCLVYSQRSPYLAAGSWDGSVHLWHLGLNGIVKVSETIRLPAAGFGQQIDLSPDGRLLGCLHGGNPACVIPILR